MSGWTREKLLTRFRQVSVWKKGDERAPHKPLLILYALGKLLEGQDEIQFKDFYEPFRDLLQEFGPPAKYIILNFPFGSYAAKHFGGRTGNGLGNEEGWDISLESRPYEARRDWPVCPGSSTSPCAIGTTFLAVLGGKMFQYRSRFLWCHDFTIVRKNQFD